MTNKKNKTDTKAKKTDAKKSEYDLVLRRDYDRYKRKAIQFEERNDRYILVIPVDGNKGWCEMGEHSALFYKYKVCDKIGVDVSIKDDYDSFYVQFKIGRARVKGFEPVRERLKRAGIYKGEEMREKCIIFALKEAYSMAEIAAMEEEENRRQTELNQIVRVKMLDPTFKVKLVEICSRLHGVCMNKMDKVASATNGVRIVQACDKALKEYYRMCSSNDASPKNRLKIWKEMREDINDVLVELQIIVELKIWKRKQAIQLSEILYELEGRANKHIAKAMREIESKGMRDDATS